MSQISAPWAPFNYFSTIYIELRIFLRFRFSFVVFLSHSRVGNLLLAFPSNGNASHESLCVIYFLFVFISLPLALTVWSICRCVYSCVLAVTNNNNNNNWSTHCFESSSSKLEKRQTEIGKLRIVSARHTDWKTLLLYYYCFILHFIFLWMFMHRNEDNMENFQLLFDAVAVAAICDVSHPHSIVPHKTQWELRRKRRRTAQLTTDQEQSKRANIDSPYLRRCACSVCYAFCFALSDSCRPL